MNVYMGRSSIQIASALTLALALTGCGTTRSVVRTPAPPPPTEAMVPCSLQMDLKLPVNFRELSFENKLAALLSRWIAATAALRECASKHQALSDYAKNVSK